MYEHILRPLLFSLDPETAHHLAMSGITSGMIGGSRDHLRTDLRKTVFGIDFPNPIGLAAGFDKDGIAIDFWERLGFGFIEVGTVTFYPQPGNPKPRLFRVQEERGLINRMGFNNHGAEALARKLAASQATIPVGVNLGKSKVTPLESAAEDYGNSYRLLHELGDYFVVNVSSPNTPGLRDLQDKDSLKAIFSTLRQIDERPPLLVKIAPDLSESALDDVVSVASEYKLAGIIATNTTIDRAMLANDPNETGGLSGAPLTGKSNVVLAHLRSVMPTNMSLIGVGGIMSTADAIRKFELGADLIQVYTGFVYGGPNFVRQILGELPPQEG